MSATAREPNMQRAGRNSLVEYTGTNTIGVLGNAPMMFFIYCTGALLTIATYGSAPHTHENATLNVWGTVTDSLRIWLSLLLTFLVAHRL